MLSEIGGMGDVKHVTWNGLQFFQQQGRFATTCATYQNKRGRGHKKGRLRIIKRKGFVQNMDVGAGLRPIA